MGIEKLYLCGRTPTPPNDKIRKTSRATEQSVSYETHNDAEQLLLQLQTEDNTTVALEITTNSIDVGCADFSVAMSENKKTYLILGAEKTGISQRLLDLADITIHIPMRGNNSSMNVISAASIACYEITRNMQ